MLYPYLRVFFIILLFSTQIWAQNDKLNRTNANGDRIGFWIIKGEDGKLLSKGRYNDEGERHGLWKFYMSPIGRYASTPDVKGYYENGVKHGRWELVDSRSKMKMKGKFVEGQMEGVWIIYDEMGDKVAAGRYRDGIRHGEWLLFKDDQVMAKGLYEDGKKVGTWEYDYYVDRGQVRIKGAFSYDQTYEKGTMEYYKVERHPKFGTEELLVGTGSYLNGLKEGRWIEYAKGLKGELISTGYYDGEGRKTGRWKTTLDSKPYRDETFNDGKRQGTFKSYYENGEPKYSTYYDDGIELGYFTSYYDNGEVKEKGAHKILENKASADTIYYKIKLPYEFKFKLLDEDHEHLNYNAIDWIDVVDFSVPAAELESRWQEYLVYGKKEKYDVQDIVYHNRMKVRFGKYIKNHKTGKPHFEGTYIPELTFEFNPITGRRERNFAKDGEWIEYDEVGYVRYKFIFEQGKLVRIEDSKGRTLDDATMQAIIN
jgi:antitoxin component YwqK of YwqJK toxin-antitoxin module